MFPSKHHSKQYFFIFKTWPCPSWDGLGLFWALAFLGLGLGFGLGPHLYFMSSFNFEKTRRKNFRCEGE